MSKGHRLRALVCERLSAAAEDIFALFERTIAEYEEELCRSKEENERKQKLLESFLSPPVPVHKDKAADDEQNDIEAFCSWTNTETSASIKTEQEEMDPDLDEEPLPECTASASASCVKSEEQRQTEHSEEEPESPHALSQFQPLHPNEEDWSQSWETSAGTSAQTNGELYNREPHNQVRAKHDDEDALGSLSPQEPKSPRNSPDADRDKPFPCSFCGKRFSNSNMLKIHTRVHTGERPYSCPVCPKSFSQNCNLRTHMRTHSGEKPFACPMCGKCFKLKSHLSSHLRTHTGEKPYSCSVCDQSFRHYFTCKMHMEKIHNVTLK